jgi:hypothetical protein
MEEIHNIDGAAFKQEGTGGSNPELKSFASDFAFYYLLFQTSFQPVFCDKRGRSALTETARFFSIAILAIVGRFGLTVYKWCRQRLPR